MKRLFAALLLAPCLVLAEPVTLDFVGVSLVTFSQATFKSIMKRDYVIAPEVLTANKKITISVKNLDSAEVPRFVENLLLRQGITTTLQDGVYYLGTTTGQPWQRNALDGAPAPLPPLPASMRSADIFGPLPSSSERVKLDGEAVQSRKLEDESVIYSPQNRTSDFMVSVVGAAFGKQSATAAGSQIVLTGSKTELDKIRKLLDSLDTLPHVVDVSASWIEVARNTGAERGISLVASVLGLKLGASLGSVGSSSAISLKNTDFQLVINALNSDARFHQVSNSRVIGDEYEKLNLNVGDETPTIASSSKDNAGNPVQNVVYRQSGVIVDVLPKVLGGGKINMLIDGQISSFKATSTGVAGSPTLIKRQVKTSVTVNDGEVLLIGGLNDSQTTDTSSGFAFLPASWAVKSEGKVQTDLVLILSAKVARL